jgi:ammonium transporter, Amt family
MIDAGNTAWLITATALVLFMTLPGLALFYRGLVRAENLLSVLMQCFAGIAATLLWLLVVSFIIAKVVQAVAGLRVSAETEQQGLDVSLHGERAYNM